MADHHEKQAVLDVRVALAAAVAAGVLGLTALSGATAGATPAAAASAQDWPMFLQNAQRTNATVDATLTVVSSAGT